MKHCSSCGADSPEQAKFCIRCGKPLAESAHPGVSNKSTPKKPFFSFRVRLIMNLLLAKNRQPILIIWMTFI